MNFWILLLLTAIHFHATSGGNRDIAVKTCDGKWASIYADKRMTIPMANPLVSNADGSFEFYSPNTCLNIKEWKP